MYILIHFIIYVGVNLMENTHILSHLTKCTSNQNMYSQVYIKHAFKTEISNRKSVLKSFLSLYYARKCNEKYCDIYSQIKNSFNMFL